MSELPSSDPPCAYWYGACSYARLLPTTCSKQACTVETSRSLVTPPWERRAFSSCTQERERCEFAVAQRCLSVPHGDAAVKNFDLLSCR
eukprot:scaffold251162_cov32-Tisochrysis_lutea.AAC.1